MAEVENRPRQYWLDVARVIAIISISLNHAVNRSYNNYSNQTEEYLSISLLSTLFKTGITVFSHYGVPLFLMISGTLLLNKNITDEAGIKRFYKHNLLDLFITCEIWYFLMYWIQVYLNGQLVVGRLPYLLWCALKTMLFVDQITFGSMWYIPMILCLYTIIPLFALVLKKVSLKVFIIPCAIVFVSSMLIPNFNSLAHIAGWSNTFNFALRSANVFSMYFLYVLAGYWIGHGGLSKIKTVWVGLGCLAVYAACFLIQLWAYSSPIEYLIDYDFALLLIGTTLLFEFLRRTIKRQGKAGGIITYISKISFGIYFIHIVIMTLLVRYYPFYEWIRPVRLLYLELVSVGGSILLIWLLSHVKILKKRLFLIKD